MKINKDKSIKINLEKIYSNHGLNSDERIDSYCLDYIFGRLNGYDMEFCNSKEILGTNEHKLVGHIGNNIAEIKYNSVNFQNLLEIAQMYELEIHMTGHDYIVDIDREVDDSFIYEEIKETRCDELEDALKIMIIKLCSIENINNKALKL